MRRFQTYPFNPFISIYIYQEVFRTEEGARVSSISAQTTQLGLLIFSRVNGMRRASSLPLPATMQVLAAQEPGLLETLLEIDSYKKNLRHRSTAHDEPDSTDSSLERGSRRGDVSSQAVSYPCYEVLERKGLHEVNQVDTASITHEELTTCLTTKVAELENALAAANMKCDAEFNAAVARENVLKDTLQGMSIRITTLEAEPGLQAHKRPVLIRKSQSLKTRQEIAQQNQLPRVGSSGSQTSETQKNSKPEATYQSPLEKQKQQQQEFLNRRAAMYQGPVSSWA